MNYKIKVNKKVKTSKKACVRSMRNNPLIVNLKSEEYEIRYQFTNECQQYLSYIWFNLFEVDLHVTLHVNDCLRSLYETFHDQFCDALAFEIKQD